MSDTIVRVGSAVPRSARYKHNAHYCLNTVILSKGEVAPPCDMHRCMEKGASWTLMHELDVQARSDSGTTQTKG